MKKLLMTVSIILVIVLLTLFSGTSDIYASMYFFGSPLTAQNSSKHPQNVTLKHISRDFKIPDNYESENYNSQTNNENIEKNSKLLNKSPWIGPKLVVIDPGHGGTDPGASSGDLLEKDLNLDISNRVNNILQRDGIVTYITRTDDSTIDLKERIYKANIKKAALFISIHSNWFYDSSFSGTMTLYNPSQNLSSGYLSEIEYAKIVQDELIKVLGTKDRGIIDRPNLAVLRHAQMPSLIVELGFLSNKNDEELLMSESFKQKAAEAIAKGIEKSIDKISDESSNPN